MRNKPCKIRKNKNVRGMALLFTLGVLMMVLVVVMMYASRVKTEIKISSTQLEMQSAKLLAQSLLPRIMITLNESVDAQDLHLFSSGTPDQNDFDWIWKLESAGHFEFQVNPTDFTSLGNKTVPFPKYTEGGSAGPEYDEESMPTWQYIHSPLDNNDEDIFSNKVLARFAFVTVPQTLRLNPNAIASHVYCRGISDLEDARKAVNSTCNICKWRLGNSPSELFYRDDILSNTTRNLIMHRHNASMLSNKFRNAQNYIYWVDTKGFTDTFLKSDESSADEERTNFVADAEKYLTVNSNYSMETFWSDDNGDGIKDVNEYYHRFNLRRTDWEKVGVAKGEGGSADPKGGEHNYILAEPRKYLPVHLDEIKKVEDSENNFPTGGIAWLNNWQDAGDWGVHGVSDALDKTKKQIAANLINFCSPASRPVVSDVHPKEWTNGNLSKEPTYTGLKRTLYLNEVHFEIAVNADVTIDGGKNPVTEKYDYDITVEYYLDTRFFAELIDMYYNTLGMKISNKSDTPDFSAYDVYFNGTCKISYNEPIAKDNNKDVDYKETEIEIPLNNMKFVRVEDAGSDAKEYLPENDTTRRGYYLYCNDAKNGFQQTFTHTVNIKDRDTQIAETTINSFIKLTKKPEVEITHVVVRRKENTSGLMADKATTFPSAADLDGEYENVDISLLKFKSSEINDIGNPELGLFDGETPYTVWMRGNFQIDDPRQNLLKEDWENAYKGDKKRCYTAYLERINPAKEIYDLEKIKHSLPFSYSVKVSDSGGGSRPRPGTPGTSGNRGGSSSSATRKPNGVNFNFDGNMNSSTPGVRYEKSNSSFKTPSQDFEVVTEPSWRLHKAKGSKVTKLLNYGPNDHVSTAFIRHGAPTEKKMGKLFREFGMMSPWELGAIHRGSRWQTLNISRSKLYSKDEQNFVDPNKNNGGNEYKYGDGPILDQIKMTNDIQVLGKIDLCQHSYDDVKNFTLGSLFLDMPLTDGNYLLQVIADDGTASSEFPISNDSLTRITPADSEKFVQELYDAIYIGMDKTIRDPGAAPKNPQAKALYDLIATGNNFFRRSDILAFTPGSHSGLSWEPFNNLRIGVGKSNATDAMNEQVIGRSINQMSVEHTKIKSIKALLLVQILRDRGKSNIRKDWNLDGKISKNSLRLSASDHLKAQLQAGYRRFSDADEHSQIFATYEGLREQIQAEDSKYDPGADSIAGEAKILATLVYDSSIQKWKITRYEFVE